MYEFMKEAVICSSFGFLMALYIFTAGYWIARFVKWVKKARKNMK